MENLPVNFEFRKAGIEDLPDIVEIYNSTIASRMSTADLEPISVESRLNWFYKHLPEVWPLWIVEFDKKVQGWFGFEAFHERPAYCHTAEISIYLAEKFRGKKLGVKILDFAEKQGLKLGYTSIIGLIFTHNTPSIRLFMSVGYTQWGLLPDIAELDGAKKSLLILGKAI